MKIRHLIPIVTTSIGLSSFTVADITDESKWPAALDFALSGRAGSIGIEAKEVASSRKITRNWETSYGSYDRDFLVGKTLAVDVTSLSQTVPTGLIVEVIWFAQDASSKKFTVYTRKGEELKLEGRLAKLTFDLPPIEMNVTNYAALGQRYTEGQKYAGWIACVRDASGKVLRHRASNPSLEALTRTSELRQLTADFEAWRAKNR